MTRLDVNKDGYISREDYQLMGKRLAEYGGLTKEQAESTSKEFMKVADQLNLKPGVKIPLLEAAKKANVALLGLTPSSKDPKAMCYDVHIKLGDILLAFS